MCLSDTVLLGDFPRIHCVVIKAQTHFRQGPCQREYGYVYTIVIHVTVRPR